jgi:uncharacterized protein (TIGR02001 family)
MHKTLFAAALLTALFPCAARADDSGPAASKPAAEISFNAALTTDYRYRGISQTRLQGALQGGVDAVDNRNGLYAGAWASTIRWTSDAGGGGDVELDLYGGKRGHLNEALSYDLGALGYIYPANGLARAAGFANADTAELYGQLGYRAGTLKYSHAVTNLFGFTDSRHSGYLDLSVNPVLGSAVVLNLHVGRQRVAHHGEASYSDWKIGLTRDFGFASAAVAAVGTNAGKRAYASPANGKFLGKSALVVTLSRTF